MLFDGYVDLIWSLLDWEVGKKKRKMACRVMCESRMMTMGCSYGAVFKALVAAWISPMLLFVRIVPT